MDNLNFRFEANLGPLIKAVSEATKLLTSFEVKLASVAKTGSLSANTAEVTSFVKALNTAQASVRGLQAQMQSMKTAPTGDMSASVKAAEVSVEGLRKAFVQMGAAGNVDKEVLTQVGSAVRSTTTQFRGVRRELAAMSTEAPVAVAGTATVEQGIKKAGTSATATSTSIDKLNEIVKSFGKVTKTAGAGAEELEKDLDEVTVKAPKMGKALDGLSSVVNRLTRLFRTFVAIQIGRFFRTAIQESMDYVEVLNLFNVALGDVAEKGKEFVASVQEQYGLDPTNIMRYVGIFHQLASAINVSDAAASTMSLGLTQVGVNLSSLFNMPIDVVMQNLQSGMQGMTRAVRKYGIDIRVSTIAIEAAALGIQGSILTMSEANRQGLRYLTILKQTSKATGDWAKTIESPANQVRILKEQITQLARAVGNTLIGAFTNVLPYINGVIMAVRMLFQLLAALKGFTAFNFGGATEQADEVASSFEDQMDGVASGAAGAAKAVKKLLAPFDELNVLNEEASSGGGGGSGLSDLGAMDPKLEAIIAEYEAKFEALGMKANRVRDAILEFLGIDMEFDADGNLTKFSFSLYRLLLNLEELTGINFMPLVGAFSRLQKAMEPITQGLGSGLEWLLEHVLQPLAKWTIEDLLPAFLDVLSAALSVVTSVIDALKGPGAWLFDNFLAPIAAFTGGIIVTVLEGLATALSAISDWISEHEALVQGMTTTVAGFFAAWKLVEVLAFIQMSGGVVGALTAITTALQAATVAKVADKLATFKLALMYTKDLIVSLMKTVVQLTTTAGIWLWYMGIQAAAGVQAVLTSIKNGILTASIAAYSLILKGATIATGALSVAMAFLAANPIVLVIAAIAAIIAIVVLMIKNWDEVGPKVKAAVGVIKGALEPLANWFKNNVINPMIRFLNALGSVWTSITNLIIRGLNSIKIDVPDWVPGIGGKTVGFNLAPVTFSPIPELATGGVINNPTTALVGEGRYPEAVIPLGDSPQLADMLQRFAAVVGETANEDINVTVNAVLDGETVYTNQQKVKRNRGYDFGLGAFAR